MHPDREAFEQDYKLHGFEYVMRKYGNIGWHYWMRPIKYGNTMKQNHNFQNCMKNFGNRPNNMQWRI